MDRAAGPRAAGGRRSDRGSGANPALGLAEDPDVLDPTLARTFVGRIVFASLCDKLVDIDENSISCRNSQPPMNGRRITRR